MTGSVTYARRSVCAMTQSTGQNLALGFAGRHSGRPDRLSPLKLRPIAFQARFNLGRLWVDRQVAGFQWLILRME